MLRRVRTTKTLAKRIDLIYFSQAASFAADGSCACPVLLPVLLAVMARGAKRQWLVEDL